jgi:hypothetical protein
VLLIAAAVVASCYQQPRLSRDRPLKCTGADASSDCPVGFSCIANVCATRMCRTDLECPMNMVCGTRGCGLPVADGGTGFRGGADGAPADVSPQMSTPDATPDSGGN